VKKARAYRELGDKEAEIEALHTFWEKGGYLPDALMALGNYYVENDRLDEAEAVFMSTNWANPFREDVHTSLGDLYMETDKPSQALSEYEVLLALDPLDKASANYRVASAWHALDNADKTMEFLMTALDIAPQYRPAQQLLLEMSRTRGSFE